MTDSGMEALAHAIIKQAVSDWKRAVLRLYKDWGDKEAASTQRECERFFRSEYFYDLTGIPAKDFMEKLWRSQQ